MAGTYRKLLFFASLFTFTLACTKVDDVARREQVKQLRLAQTKSGLVEQAAVKAQVISEETIPKILKGYLDPELFPTVGNYQLGVISDDGEDLIYVLNLEDGGWVLVSRILLPYKSPVLAFNATGSFDAAHIESQETAFWLDAAKSFIRKSLSSVPQGDVPLKSQIDSSELFSKQSGARFGDMFFWVLVPVDTYTTPTVYAHVDSLLETKWGQRYPWNYLCPRIGTDQCPTGCVAVAFAQTLYYLHNHLGVPNNLYHQIDTTFDWHVGGYYFPNHNMTNFVANSSRWNDMPLVNPGYQTAGTNYVGDLMIEIGMHQLLHYSFQTTTTGMSPALFSHYGLSAALSAFDASVAVSQLNDSIPVMVRGSYPQPYSDVGHAWVIDGHRTYQTTYDHVFQWKRIPAEYSYYYQDYVQYSDFDMRLLFPGVVENQLVHEYSYASSTTFHMNWGWEGYQDGFFIMSEIDYSEQQQMISNIQVI